MADNIQLYKNNTIIYYIISRDAFDAEPKLSFSEKKQTQTEPRL